MRARLFFRLWIRDGWRIDDERIAFQSDAPPDGDMPVHELPAIPAGLICGRGWRVIARIYFLGSSLTVVGWGG